LHEGTTWIPFNVELCYGDYNLVYSDRYTGIIHYHKTHNKIHKQPFTCE